MWWLTHLKPMFHFYTPENIRKPEVFWYFQGVSEWKIGLKGVKDMKACERPCNILEVLQSYVKKLWNQLFQWWKYLRRDWETTSYINKKQPFKLFLVMRCTKKLLLVMQMGLRTEKKSLFEITHSRETLHKNFDWNCY